MDFGFTVRRRYIHVHRELIIRWCPEWDETFLSHTRSVFSPRGEMRRVLLWKLDAAGGMRVWWSGQRPTGLHDHVAKTLGADDA
jgi:hypothetical protein